MVHVIAAMAVLMASDQGLPQTAVPPPNTIPLVGKHATDTDRQVLEALLVSFASDDEFPPPTDSSKSSIVLHRRTPKRIEPIISASQVSFETGGKELPKDAWDDLVRRNVVRLDPRSREILYEGLNFDSRVQVANAFPGPEPPFAGPSFEESFPNARGWVEAWVPGYSKDTKTAVVRARVGPTKKWATVTAILKRQDGKWAVTWRKFSIYN